MGYDKDPDSCNGLPYHRDRMYHSSWRLVPLPLEGGWIDVPGCSSGMKSANITMIDVRSKYRHDHHHVSLSFSLVRYRPRSSHLCVVLIASAAIQSRHVQNLLFYHLLPIIAF
jgi:hypothetical protein